MYLTYQEYTAKGGTLSSSAFAPLERKAENLINAQANGLTGERIGKLAELPNFLKDLVFDAISLLNEFNGAIVSESQSLGGVSESKTYNQKDYTAETDELIKNAFIGNGMGKLLYKGLNK